MSRSSEASGHDVTSSCLNPTMQSQGHDVAGSMQSADALRSVREAFEAQGKVKTEKKPAVKRHAAGQTWCGSDVLVGLCTVCISPAALSAPSWACCAEAAV